MSDDKFEATFRISLDRATVWRRLTEKQSDDDELWMPGFDSAATISQTDPEQLLHVVKKDPPVAGTDIVVTLADDEHGTRVRVVQSGFGEHHGDLRGPAELFELGWRRIIADLHTYLATGVHARRFLRAWADFGADSTPSRAASVFGMSGRAGSPNASASSTATSWSPSPTRRSRPWMSSSRSFGSWTLRQRRHPCRRMDPWQPAPRRRVPTAGTLNT